MSMWISKRELESRIFSLEKRMEKAESENRENGYEISDAIIRVSTLEVESTGQHTTTFITKTWTPRQAIEAILKHLGLTLEEGPAWTAKWDNAEPFGGRAKP